jgi:hypothetical protein
LLDRSASSAYRRRLSLLATADAVVTDSRSAADDVIEHLGIDHRRIRVIGAGVSPAFRLPTEPLGDRIATLRTEWPTLRARYVLVPTAADWRKNSIGAIEAFAALPPEVRDARQLVLFCRLTDGQLRALEEVADAAGIGGQVMFTGYVPDELLILLYQSAELVFVPTFYEGFGLPVLEARRCGARVICSNTSSLTEVLVDVQARFNPFDAEDTAETLRRALVDDRYVAALTRVPDPGFGWDLAVEALIDVYDELLKDLAARAVHRAQPTSLRMRVGVVGSMFPAGDDESEMLRDEVIRPLAEDDRLDVVAYPVVHSGGLLSECGCPIRSFPELAADWQAGRLDAVVYVYGESPHRLLVAANHAIPGHAVMLSSEAALAVADRTLSSVSFGAGNPLLELTSALLERHLAAST